MVGTSGAITSLAGLHLGLPRYDRNIVDGLWMQRSSARRRPIAC
jgi:exopolyphosphatase/guanosine-5'-triphosphate,3'-diphosphate pyrophosphatase